MDAVDSAWGALALATGDPLRHADIGEEHVVLDEPVGVHHPLDQYFDGLAVGIEAETDLFGVEVDAARLETPRPHFPGEAVQAPDLIGEVALPGL